MEKNDIFSMLNRSEIFFVPQVSIEGHTIHFGSGRDPSKEGFCRRCQRDWEDLIVESGNREPFIRPCTHERDSIVHNLF